jgi:acetylornithine deacetylase/succinyl-diaminopimelate desuccinylase-like protein
MTDTLQAYDAYIEEHFAGFIEELRAFCAQPALAAQRIGLAESVALVQEKLEALGGTVRVVPVEDGAPVILGELGAGPRTLLLYNHYDVQPPEPLELWDSPPYAGAIRDGKFYARGVADDRGDLLGRIQAVRAYQATVGPLPLRLRWLIEGEEEVSSPHLGPVVRANAAWLQADWCAWENGSRDEDNHPTVICGQKGLLYVELRATGAARDVHSREGGIVPNPAWRLVQALATIKDSEDRITLDGMDALIAPLSPADRAAAAAMPFDEAAVARSLGVDHWQQGLHGRDVLTTRIFAPTANIAGFTSGYGGPGSKTIVPSTALVKMDFRLVPDQTPEAMLALLRAHLDRRGFTDVEVISLGGHRPGKTPVDHPFIQQAVAVWAELAPGGAVAQPMTGGSGPFALIANELGIPTAKICGPGYAGSALHAPNEHIRLEDYHASLRYWGRLFTRLAAL